MHGSVRKYGGPFNASERHRLMHTSLLVLKGRRLICSSAFQGGFLGQQHQSNTLGLHGKLIDYVQVGFGGLAPRIEAATARLLKCTTRLIMLPTQCPQTQKETPELVTTVGKIAGILAAGSKRPLHSWHLGGQRHLIC